MTVHRGATMWMVLGGFICTLSGAEQTKTYEISGGSVKQLRESLNRERPLGRDGVPHDAVTVWDIQWRYRYRQSPLGCTLTSFDVSLEIVMTVPKWVNEADAPPSLVEQWRNYYAALLVHEDGHKGVAAAAAAAIRRVPDAISPQSSCAELARMIDESAKGVLDECRQKQREYDAQTDHGRTQGARFP